MALRSEVVRIDSEIVRKVESTTAAVLLAGFVEPDVIEGPAADGWAEPHGAAAHALTSSALENFTILASLVELPNVGQHPLVAAGSSGRCGAFRTRSWSCTGLAALAMLTVGCDSTVTSVGAWAPIMVEPEPEPDPVPSNSIYLEAESGELSVVSEGTEPQPSGFSIAADVSASNGQYLEPPLGTSDQMPGAARALYRFEVATDGDFVIWGRIYSPHAQSNRFWFQVDGGDWHRWRISTGDIWYWDDFHNNLDYWSELHFQLTAGPHQLVIANCTAGAKLDRLYVTSQGDEPPGNDTPCDPPHSIESAGECLPSCGSLAPPGMNTTCQGCDGRPELIGAYDCPVCCVAP